MADPNICPGASCFNGWSRVIFSADCDMDGHCPCGVDYAEACMCPGPTQDGIEYLERDGVLYGREIIKPTGDDNVY